MAIQVTQSMDSNEVLSGQPISFTLSVFNPVGGTAAFVTGIAPRVSVTSGGPASGNIGRPLLSIPEAPVRVGGGQTQVFTWKECLFMGQQPQAQPNAPAGSTPLTSTIDVYTDTAGTLTSNVSTLYIFPNVGVNGNVAVAKDPGGAFFALNQNSWLAGMMAAPVPL